MQSVPMTVGGMKPRISVVIPCYNAGPFLRETLASVMAQSYLPHEVIVVDDGSTDNSTAIAGSFGPPVRVLRQTNQGESVARNVGIARSTGDWVALLDADDIWEPQKLERQADIARGLSSDFVCVYTDFYRFDGKHKEFPEPRPEYHAEPNGHVRMLLDWCVQTSTCLIRREVLEKVRFPEEVRHGEDHVFFALVRERGRFVRIPEPLCGYRRSVSQLTRSRDHMSVLYKSLIDWFGDNSSRYPPCAQEYVRARISAALAECHDNAFWRRRFDQVRAYRRLFAAFSPGAAPPSSFKKRLSPAWLFALKDWWDGRSEGSPARIGVSPPAPVVGNSLHYTSAVPKE